MPPSVPLALRDARVGALRACARAVRLPRYGSMPKRQLHSLLCALDAAARALGLAHRRRLRPLNSHDPVTLLPLGAFPFLLVEPSGEVYGFDGAALAGALLGSGVFRHPYSYRSLSLPELRRLASAFPHAHLGSALGAKAALGRELAEAAAQVESDAQAARELLTADLVEDLELEALLDAGLEAAGRGRAGESELELLAEELEARTELLLHEDPEGGSAWARTWIARLDALQARSRGLVELAHLLEDLLEDLDR
jgi:hypothetical protein